MEEIRFNDLADRLRESARGDDLPEIREREIVTVCIAAAHRYFFAAQRGIDGFDPKLATLNPRAWPKVGHELGMMHWGRIASFIGSKWLDIPGGHAVGMRPVEIFPMDESPDGRWQVQRSRALLEVGTRQRARDYAAVMDRLHEMVVAAKPATTGALTPTVGGAPTLVMPPPKPTNTGEANRALLNDRQFHALKIRFRKEREAAKCRAEGRDTCWKYGHTGAAEIAKMVTAQTKEAMSEEEVRSLFANIIKPARIASVLRARFPDDPEFRK